MKFDSYIISRIAGGDSGNGYYLVGDGKMFRYFQLSEFACGCCGRSEINIEFLTRLHEARVIANTTFVINSGYRCQKHNMEVGSTSQNHTSGHAADIKARNNHKRGKILRGLYRAGFNRVGIRKDFIHVDDMDKVQSCWLY